MMTPRFDPDAATRDLIGYATCVLAAHDLVGPALRALARGRMDLPRPVQAEHTALTRDVARFVKDQGRPVQVAGIIRGFLLPRATARPLLGRITMAVSEVRDGVMAQAVPDRATLQALNGLIEALWVEYARLA